MWKCRLETYFFQKFSEIFRKAIFCNFCLWVFLYLCSNFLMLHFWLQNVIFLSRNLFNESRGGSRTAARSKMERFVMIVNDWKPLTIITSCSILDVATALDPPPESLDYQPTNTLMMSLIVFWVKKKTKIRTFKQKVEETEFLNYAKVSTLFYSCYYRSTRASSVWMP